MRRYGGISGFTNKDESPFDAVTAGHSGASVSTALGIAEGKALAGDDSYTVAVVGDGSFTNGMIQEAINCSSGRKVRLIIVLNDNGMSISENVGGLSDYFARIRTSEGYFSLKCFMKNNVSRIPFAGKFIVSLSRKFRDVLKRILVSGNLFESMGLRYLGPVNGGDIDRLISVFEEAKTYRECTLIHVRTVKGKGYSPAETYPEKYHAVPPFNAAEGASELTRKTFTDVVSETLCRLAGDDEKICAVCAAMPSGTGLDSFAGIYPDRFFDTGIAEEHAITFSAGLALAGYRPFCVMYSTFAQRAYDQLWHDAALQKAPMKLLISHAGFVPGDGVTHQGLFDAALFSSVPGVRIFAPDGYGELREMIESKSPFVDIIRYPKGEEPRYDRSRYVKKGDVYVWNLEDAEAVIITYGRMIEVADAAAELLANFSLSESLDDNPARADDAKACYMKPHNGIYSVRTGVLRLACIEPLDTEAVWHVLKDVTTVYFLEEGVRTGGICEKCAALLAERGYSGKTIIHAVEKEFVPHGSTEELMKKYGFTAENVARRIIETMRES